MEIFGGLAVMMSILMFFLAIVWLVMPFVVFAIKGKVDRSVFLLEDIERRLAAIDSRLAALEHSYGAVPPAASGPEKTGAVEPSES